MHRAHKKGGRKAENETSTTLPRRMRAHKKGSEIGFPPSVLCFNNIEAFFRGFSAVLTASHRQPRTLFCPIRAGRIEVEEIKKDFNFISCSRPSINFLCARLFHVVVVVSSSRNVNGQPVEPTSSVEWKYK